jgi:hypothetical protein
MIELPQYVHDALRDAREDSRKILAGEKNVNAREYLRCSWCGGVFHEDYAVMDHKGDGICFLCTRPVNRFTDPYVPQPGEGAHR